MIKAFNWIALITGDEIPKEVLASNVIITKLAYNICLSAWFLYNLERFSREKLGRKARGISREEPFYWWSFIVGLILFIFLIFDGVSVYKIFYV